MKISRSFWKHLAVISGLGVGIALSGAGSAQAQTLSDTDVMQVTATVTPSCVIAASPLSFGSVDGLAVTNASTQINISCVSGLAVDITLDYGARGNRTMIATLTTDVLPYAVAQDAGGTLWGDIIGTDSVAYVGAGLTTTDPITVFGSIGLFSGLPADDYTDTINASVWY